MQSLRTRRPSQSNKPTRQPSKLSKTAGPSPAKNKEKDARKSRVDDRIKKRMSMRYADISEPTGANVPDMPAMPLGLRPGIGGGARDDGPVPSSASIRRDGREREDPRAAEKRMLDKEDFDADACEFL